MRAVDAAGNVSVSGAVTALTQPVGTDHGCLAPVTVQTQWGEGDVIEPTRVTNNNSSAINGWSVTFTRLSGAYVPGSLARRQHLRLAVK